ncbi:hypothetical protein CPB83DRAFT_96963 [Crepidotus variabilis]|uniref:Uncharacterized protein n=1 Tax=Crepidotus variabilis TaxID=179855 RepID=A0A9P6E4T1_9AGAR|nr:hypothetical protein CPB83DRAFT_96963 [Crepidotus variabilis]
MYIECLHHHFTNCIIIIITMIVACFLLFLQILLYLPCILSLATTSLGLSNYALVLTCTSQLLFIPFHLPFHCLSLAHRTTVPYLVFG